MRTADLYRHVATLPPVKRSPRRKVAEMLDLHPQSMYRWGEVVPELHAWRLHHMLDGAVPLRLEDYQREEEGV